MPKLRTPFIHNKYSKLNTYIINGTLLNVISFQGTHKIDIIKIKLYNINTPYKIKIKILSRSINFIKKWIKKYPFITFIIKKLNI